MPSDTVPLHEYQLLQRELYATQLRLLDAQAEIIKSRKAAVEQQLEQSPAAAAKGG